MSTRDRKPRPASSKYITAEGAKRLRDELEQLWTVERPRVTQEVSDAAAGFTGNVSTVILNIERSEPTCYVDCDNNQALNVGDFICFQAAFAGGIPYANCDASTTPPVLNVNDFICFQSRFAAACSAP